MVLQQSVCLNGDRIRGRGTESASGFGPGDRIRGGTRSAVTPAGDLVVDVKTKLSIAGCLTASEFAFTSEQHGRLVYEAAF